MQMNNNASESLTPALLLLLQTSVSANTANADELADLLCLSPHTIQTEYKRICQLLKVHSRTAAILVALKHGWITLET